MTNDAESHNSPPPSRYALGTDREGFDDFYELPLPASSNSQSPIPPPKDGSQLELSKWS